MAYNAGDLAARMSINLNPFRQGIQSVVKQAQSLGSSLRTAFNGVDSGANKAQNAIKQTGNAMKDLERIAGGIILSQAFYAGVNAIQDATAAVIEFSNNMEKAQISLEYFLGSSEQAKGFIANMKDFAATTAFSTEQALSLSRRLMAAQFNPKQVRGVMEILNDASAASGGTAEQMDRVVLALSQIKTNGKLAGQELRQLAEAGIPIYKILQEELNLTGKEIMNIGDLKIPGDLGISAILNGLEKRYKGAAERIANTMPGMLETIKDNLLFISSEIFQTPYKAAEGMIRKWRDGIEKARDAMQKNGLGGMVDEMFKPETAKYIRLITGSILELGKSFVQFQTAMMPAYRVLGQGLAGVLATILPLLAGAARAISSLAQMAMQAVPGLKYLIAAILGLLIAKTAAKVMMLLWRILALGKIASTVAQAVNKLRIALFALFTFSNPWVSAIVIMAGALLYFTGAIKYVGKWLDWLMDKLGQIGGFDVDKILEPEDTGIDKWADSFNDAVDGVGDNLGDTLDDAEDKGDKTAKKMKDTFIAAFDEVFQVPEKDKDDKDDSGTGGGSVPGLPNIDDTIDKATDKIPREIELPKFVFPPIDWPKVPPALTRPIDIKFNFPKFPDFGTVFEPLLVTIRGLSVEVPKLLPNLFPQKELDGLKNRIKEWTGEIVGELGTLRQRVGNGIGNAWDGLTLGLPAATGKALKGIKEWTGNVVGEITLGLAPKLGTAAAKAWGALPTGLPAATVEGLKGIKEWAGNVAGGLAGFKDRLVEGVKTAAISAAATLGSFSSNMASAVASWIPSLITGIGLVLSSVKVVWDKGWQSIANFFGTMKDSLTTALSEAGTFLSEHWKSILTAVGLVVIGAIALIAAPFAGIGAAAAGAAGGVSVAGVAITTAVTGLVVTGIAAFKKYGKQITDWASSTWTTFSKWSGDVTTETGKWVIKQGASFLSWYTDTKDKVGKFAINTMAKFTEAWTSAKKTTTDKIGDIKTKLGELLSSGKTNMASLSSTVISKFTTWTSNAWGKTKTFRTNFADTIKTLPSKFSSGIASIPEKFQTLIDKLPGKAVSIVTTIASKFAALPGKVWEAIKSIPSKFASVFSQIKLPSFSMVGDAISATFSSIGNIAGFARGGVVDKDSIVRVGEKGRREAIVPMENETAMKPFVDAVVNGMKEGNNTPPGTPNTDERPVVYVGTLIADQRSLRELERKLKIVRQDDDSRGR